MLRAEQPNSSGSISMRAILASALKRGVANDVVRARAEADDQIGLAERVVAHPTIPDPAEKLDLIQSLSDPTWFPR
jgi:hypothetical protein